VPGPKREALMAELQAKRVLAAYIGDIEKEDVGERTRITVLR
jgi:hypothetical protein